MALTDNLISFWELEESGGSTRVDSHGAHDLTDVRAVTQVAGKVGNAAQFTAADDEYLLLADHADLSVGDIDFTWAAWVYVDALTGAPNMYIVGKEGADAASTDYAVRVNTSDSSFQFFTGGADYSSITATPTASTGTWYFVVAWHDTADDTLNIQINNGTPDSAARTNAPTDSATNLHIGGAGLDETKCWNGRIDQVGFWKRVLTSGERTSLYNSGNGLSYAAMSGPTPKTFTGTSNLNG